MASGFFMLLDDIAVLMDDIAVNAKIAAKNTAGVLGDDLAVNAAKASTFKSSRELPIIWAITKGSLINKIIIVPIMLALSIYFPQAIVPILIAGGLFLSYEGAHGIWGYLFPENAHESSESDEKSDTSDEKSKIKSAIITDFILSIEIVLIALSTVADQSIIQRSIIVSLIAILATIGVYGIVALLVRLDDMGLALAHDKPQDSFMYKLGMKMVTVLPYIIKILSVVGVFAMLLVAGGIFLHNIPILHEVMHAIPTLMAEIIASIIVGGVVMMVVHFVSYLVKKETHS